VTDEQQMLLHTIDDRGVGQIVRLGTRTELHTDSPGWERGNKIDKTTPDLRRRNWHGHVLFRSVFFSKASLRWADGVYGSAPGLGSV
jgi:hypothetical protein